MFWGHRPFFSFSYSAVTTRNYRVKIYYKDSNSNSKYQICHLQYWYNTVKSDVEKFRILYIFHRVWVLTFKKLQTAQK